jgi:signal transduction histidine kinase
VEISVRDEGPGIAPIDLPHVFEQFYTADPSRRRGGTGLGLAMARRIVDAHGGTITAASPDMAGALITLRLPIRAKPRAHRPLERPWSRVQTGPQALEP